MIAGCEQLLTMAQVAEVLAIPEHSARALGRTGGLPVVKMGRRVRVRPSALQAFIEGKEVHHGLRAATPRAMGAGLSRRG
jgi:excisionase family DNA binding protein